MTPEEYVVLAGATAPTQYDHFSSDIISPAIVHAWIGVTTEAGESGDVIKKALIYGKEPDLINLDEEMGDKLWYIALYCNERQITFSDLMEQNIAKLQQRYPDKFSADLAINRDVDAERKVLEKANNEREDMKLTRQFIHQYKHTPQDDDVLLVERTVWQYRYTTEEGVRLWTEVPG